MKDQKKLENVLSLSSEVDVLCDPLGSLLGVTYFNYVKLLPGNVRAILTNRPKYISDFYQNDLHLDSNVLDIEHLKYDEYITWDTFEDGPTFCDAREFYDIANGLTIVKPSDQFVELFYFGTHKGNYSACEQYRSQKEVFERFILYFRNKGKNLIQFSDQNLIKTEGPDHQISDFHVAFAKGIDRILSNPNIRFVWITESRIVTLNRKETEYCAYMMLQFSLQEVANTVELSKRTIEPCVEKIKDKLLCSSKPMLLRKLFTLDVIDIYTNVNYGTLHQYPDLNCGNFDVCIKSMPVKNISFLYASQEYTFTKMECIHLFLLCNGVLPQEVSFRLGCSARMHETHTANMRRKVGVKKTSELCLIVSQTNLVSDIAFAFPEVLNYLF